MATMRYALSKGEHKRLALSWGMSYSNFTVRLDGQVIATIPNRKALEAGVSIPLEDGSSLFVYREKGFVRISRNGRPLPGSIGDPQAKLNGAISAILFVGVLSIVVGLAGLGGTNPQKTTYWITLGSGVLYGAFIFFVRSRSKIALGIAFAVYALDTLGILFLVFSKSPGSYVIALGEHLLFLSFMWRGFGAIDELNTSNDTSTPSNSILQPLPTRFPNSADSSLAPAPAVVAPSFLSRVSLDEDKPAAAPISQSSANQLLKQAVDIVKSGGDKHQAKSLVNEALKVEPHNADGWYLIGYLADNAIERKAALQRTLALNPDHKRAQQEIARLTNS